MRWPSSRNPLILALVAPALLFLAADFNPEAATVIDWTRSQINDRRYAKEQNHAIWNYLGDLEEKRQIGDVLYLHASPRRPTKGSTPTPANGSRMVGWITLPHNFTGPTNPRSKVSPPC